MRLYKSNYSFVFFVIVKKSDGYIKRHGMWTKSTKSVTLYDKFPSTKPVVNDIKTIIVGSVFDLNVFRKSYGKSTNSIFIERF